MEQATGFLQPMLLSTVFSLSCETSLQSSDLKLKMLTLKPTVYQICAFLCSQNVNLWTLGNYQHFRWRCKRRNDEKTFVNIMHINQTFLHTNANWTIQSLKIWVAAFDYLICSGFLYTWMKENHLLKNLVNMMGFVLYKEKYFLKQQKWRRATSMKILDSILYRCRYVLDWIVFHIHVNMYWILYSCQYDFLFHIKIYFKWNTLKHLKY